MKLGMILSHIYMRGLKKFQHSMKLLGFLKMTKEEIQKLRKDLNMTQESFAHFVGVSWRTIARWEAGGGRPSRLALDRIRELLGRSENDNGGSSQTN